MRCGEVHEYIQRNLDQDLSPMEKMQMDEHLRTCSECQQFFKEMEALSMKLADLPEVDPPYSLVDAILPKLEAEKNDVQMRSASSKTAPIKQRNWRIWMSIGGSVAAVLAFLLVWDQTMNRSHLKSEVQMQAAMSPEMNSKEEASVAQDHDAGMASNQTAENYSSLERLPEKSKPADDGDLPPGLSLSQPDKKEVALVSPGQNASKEDASVLENNADLEETVPEEKEQALALAPMNEQPNPEESFAKQHHHMLATPEQSMQRDVSTFVSPTGEFVAKLEQNRVVVYDRTGNAIFQGHTWGMADKVTIQWTDEATVEYIIHLQADADEAAAEHSDTLMETEKWIIDLKRGQERKQ